MIIVRIKNDETLRVNVINYLAEKAADFDTVYADVSLQDTDAWVVTNTQASVPIMEKVLYLGDAADCPKGAIHVPSVENLADYIEDDLSDAADLDLSSILDLGTFDPVATVYDLVGTLVSPDDPELEFDFTEEDLVATPEPIHVSITKELPEKSSVEPILEVVDRELIRVSLDKSELVETRNEEPEEEDWPAPPAPVPEPVMAAEPVVEIVPTIIPPQTGYPQAGYPQQGYPQSPMRQPQAQPPHIVQPPQHMETALQETGIGARTVRRRQEIYPAQNRRTPAPLGRSGRVHTRRDNAIARRVYVITGTSNNCGISSFCYSLAAALSKSTIERTLLIDMDVLKPGLTKKLTNLYDLEMDSDDTIDNFATMELDDLLTNVEFLTSKIAPTTGGHFSMIRGSALSFKNRKILCSMDYTETLDMLSEVYQNIILDIGAYNGMHPYQDSLINNHYCTIVLLDCSSIQAARESISIASQIGESYKAILSKCDTKINPFKIQNSLQRPILGKILSRTSAADVWRTGDPFGTIKEPMFREDWEMLVDEVKRM